MFQFFVNNWQTILLIYVIGAALTFVTVCLFWVWVAKSDAKERELYPEEHDFDDEDGGWSLFLFVALMTATLMAVIWWGVPLILLFLLLYDWTQRHFPNLMGNLYEDIEEENDND